MKLDRRSFAKLMLVAPAVPVVGFADSVSSTEESLPKALLVDPYQVNIEDLKNIEPPSRIKLIRLRRPAWGTGDPVRRIF